MSNLIKETEPKTFTFNDALSLARDLGRSQGSWGRYAKELEALDAEKRDLYSKALEEHNITNGIDYIMLIEG